ncbi:hypothetical protein FA13DRAFT_1784183 [Coprinellus micaceus]|uniref:Uncharacterized protein n=1 Tax=Coprinellus micaceus TaxID=71717 RepID=A0A4Y7TZ22_COPMI|nr:hypothetical protein FA13DRAFT_1784183 [Coprinellus micaceus]
MGPRIQRHFAPLSLRSRFGLQRLLTPPPSSRRRIYPIVDFNPVTLSKSPSPPQSSQDREGEYRVLLDEARPYLNLLVRQHLQPEKYGKQRGGKIKEVVTEVVTRYPALTPFKDQLPGAVKDALESSLTPPKKGTGLSKSRQQSQPTSTTGRARPRAAKTPSPSTFRAVDSQSDNSSEE